MKLADAYGVSSIGKNFRLGSLRLLEIKASVWVKRSEVESLVGDSGTWGLKSDSRVKEQKGSEVVWAWENRRRRRFAKGFGWRGGCSSIQDPSQILQDFRDLAKDSHRTFDIDEATLYKQQLRSRQEFQKSR
ncbi:hypothetical protein IEQ34_011937 [Dendrobium chrysotoxum]|uniref:Uncharacterized protein n=1 Tax=Dendrobium chrysotoxum TaxID=161865 RepID=A0AAV7GU20_DENCH|nr:hypothetical protein IEQ34_011937 [Dendrobium chrysotoxum]